MKILDRINYVSFLAFDFDLESYLQSRQKALIMLEIDTINKKYKPLDTDLPATLLNAFNAQYQDAKAGYLVDVHAKFPTDLNCDLISLSDIVLHSNPIDLDTIIVHELTHCLIDSNQVQNILQYGDWEEDAIKIFNHTDPDQQHRTRHTQEFCNLLCQGCLHYTHRTANFLSGWGAVRSAMRFDAFFDEE